MTEHATLPLFLDGLTTLPTLTGWVSACPNGSAPAEGCLLAVSVRELETSAERYHRDIADELFLTLARRVRQAMRDDDVLLRGHGFTLWLWLPGAHESDAFRTRLHGALAEEPVIWPDGAALRPPVLAAQAVAEGEAFEPVRQALTTALARARQVPAGPESAETPLATLNNRLDALRLFGREPLLESLLAQLHLPALRPETIVLTGEPDSGKSRVLSCAARYLDGQGPMAEVACRPSDRLVPYHLLVAMIGRLLAGWPPQALRETLCEVCAQYPWLGSLFPALPIGVSITPPAELGQLRRGLEAMLLALAGAGPHLALVHDLHAADDESLAVLSLVQMTPGHGLRLLATVDADSDILSLAMRDWLPPSAVQVHVTPLLPSQVADYLVEALPEIAGPEVTEALQHTAHGQPLAMEATLRGWVDGEALRLTNYGWIFDAVALRIQRETGLHARERERLAAAALLGSATVEQFALLWETSPEDARTTVLRGRAFGLLLPPDPLHPNQVEFSSPDDVTGLLRTLTPAARTAAHARIAAVLEAASEQATPALSYHLSEAGEQERARLYIDLVQNALPALLAMANMAAAGAVAPPATAGWNVPVAPPPVQADVTRIVTAALAIRLAGVRFRLYPETSEMVQGAVQDAVDALQALLDTRPSFIIAYDGRLVTYDGQVLQRREEQLIARDFQQWLTDAGVEAIGFLPGVNKREVACLMRALGTYEPSDGQEVLRVALENPELAQIRLLPRQGRGMSGPPTGWTPPAPPSAALAPLAASLAPLAEHAASLPAETISPSSGKNWLTAPLTFDADTWTRLPEMLNEATGAIRHVMMTDLTRWLARQDAHSDADVSTHLDPLLHSRLAREEDPRVLAETLQAAEQRIRQLIAAEQLDELASVLTVIYQRHRNEKDDEVCAELTAGWERLRTDTGLAALLERALLQGGAPEVLARLLALLGEPGENLLFRILLQPIAPPVRARIITIVRHLGENLCARLTQELRTAHPAPVSVNLLQALAEVGNRGALGAISDKLLHEDAAVRAEALDAATRIAREKANPYLARGLKDHSPTVRARAASLVMLCPDPALLAPLVRMLTAGGFAAEDNENVQLAACLALGCYHEDAARDALLQVLRPRLFPTLRRRSDQVRGAAVTALANLLPATPVEEAIQQAMQDRSPLVSQTARRVWLKYTESPMH